MTKPAVTPDTVLEHGLRHHSWPPPDFTFEDEDRQRLFELHERHHSELPGSHNHTHEGTPA